MNRSKIFICYRRTTDNAARMLQTALKQKFGEKVVFLDVDHIEPGVDFVNRLQGQISETAAMVVVIGPDWLTLTGSDGARRIDDPLDPVHVEVAAALFSGIDIYPVLVGGATMPSEDDLPLMLRPFARRNARKVPVDEFFPAAMEGLTKALDASLKAARGPVFASASNFAGWGVGIAGAALAVWTIATMSDGDDRNGERRFSAPAEGQSTGSIVPSAQDPEPLQKGRTVERRLEEREPNNDFFSAMTIAPGDLLEGSTSPSRDDIDYVCVHGDTAPGRDFDLSYAIHSLDHSFTVEAFKADGARVYDRFAKNHSIRATLNTGPLCIAVHHYGSDAMGYRLALTKTDPE